MNPNEKNQQPSATPPAVGSPADLDKQAENENPRANENLTREASDTGETSSDVGSEITDGEDA